MRHIIPLVTALLVAALVGKLALSADDSETNLERLAGHWISDLDALNEANQKEGKPVEEPVGVKMLFGTTTWSSEYNGMIETVPFYLAKDTIWEGDLCRGAEFDAEAFKVKLQDDNGTVIVSIEDGDTFCRTIETLTRDTLITSYVGARLNVHYYKRLN